MASATKHSHRNIKKAGATQRKNIADTVPEPVSVRILRSIHFDEALFTWMVAIVDLDQAKPGSRLRAQHIGGKPLFLQHAIRRHGMEKLKIRPTEHNHV